MSRMKVMSRIEKGAATTHISLVRISIVDEGAL